MNPSRCSTGMTTRNQFDRLHVSDGDGMLHQAESVSEYKRDEGQHEAEAC
jgi:hypothetical protein